ncbi:MAG: hypothetical protein HOI80_00830 [Alphaproteobacteria bacterium]|jgi:hypothetical protein|nr:hypothetical protein [Alphaproteobacteria bacterium]MBT5390274.1 hypothetical protein [Alphaproteobacteria bacterium]MBT5540186.1 hypothetical protein [Alphaproteobacteria bacterium]MBT5654031.1 hypothetical protein [Alphaproteobacteria bacterium]
MKKYLSITFVILATLCVVSKSKAANYKLQYDTSFIEILKRENPKNLPMELTHAGQTTSLGASSDPSSGEFTFELPNIKPGKEFRIDKIEEGKRYRVFTLHALNETQFNTLLKDSEFSAQLKTYINDIEYTITLKKIKPVVVSCINKYYLAIPLKTVSASITNNS